MCFIPLTNFRTLKNITTYGNLGSVFHSLDEFQNAKEYHKKALAIAIEIGDRGVEGTTDGKLGKVFDSFGEYQNA